MMKVRKLIVIGMTIISCIVLPHFAAAQDGKLGSNYVPSDGMVTALLNPAAVLSSDTLAMYPTEIADAWCLENFGMPLSEVESVRVVVATPGPNDAMFGVVVQFTNDVDLKKINPQFIGQEIEVDDMQCFELNGPPGVVIHQSAPRTIIVGSANYLDNLIAAKDGDKVGALSRYAKAMKHDGQLTVVFAVEPVRPLITGLLQTIMDQIPPPFLEFTEIPELLDAVAIKVNVNDVENGLQIAMLGRDEDSAQQLEQIIQNGIAMSREMVLMQMMNELEGDGAVPEAMRKYVNRMADKVVGVVTPERTGKVLMIRTSLNYGMTSQLMVLGTMMPVVRMANIPAPRAARASNNLKQIGLAMHNYHSAYKTLPGNAIRDDEGKPLLSWRVAVLPFLDEVELYQQFHLDEPWDSEHNLKLVNQMPDVFQHPVFQTDGGKTHYQAPLNETNCVFNEEEAVRFRDMLDGLSNTVMLVPVVEAVEWTKPSDWEVDFEDPFSDVLLNDDGTFNALFSDGAVQSLTSDIGIETMKALLTIAGRERVDF